MREARSLAVECPCFWRAGRKRIDQCGPRRHGNAPGENAAGSDLDYNERPARHRNQTTDEASRDPTIKQMNEDEKWKVDSKTK